MAEHTSVSRAFGATYFVDGSSVIAASLVAGDRASVRSAE